MKSYVVLFKETPELGNVYSETHLVADGVFRDEIPPVNKWLTQGSFSTLDEIRNFLINRKGMTEPGLPMEWDEAGKPQRFEKTAYAISEIILGEVAQLWGLFFDAEGKFKRVMKWTLRSNSDLGEKPPESNTYSDWLDRFLQRVRLSKI